MYARVLPMDASLDACHAVGLKASHIIAMQGPFSEEMNIAMLHTVSASWLVTKDGSILEYFVHKVSNGFAEGINNKIKVIKRMAYGFHDFEYFRLKILAATGYLKALPFIN